MLYISTEQHRKKVLFSEQVVGIGSQRKTETDLITMYNELVLDGNHEQ